MHHTQISPAALRLFREDLGRRMNASAKPLSPQQAAALVGVGVKTWRAWEAERAAPPLWLDLTLGAIAHWGMTYTEQVATAEARREAARQAALPRVKASQSKRAAPTTPERSEASDAASPPT